MTKHIIADELDALTEEVVQAGLFELAKNMHALAERLRGAVEPAKPQISQVVPCPYCGQNCEFVDSAEVYHGKSFGMIYLCRKCDAYCGCHKSDGRPLGHPANKELRKWRMNAHHAFDRLWRGDHAHMDRGGAYRWLATTLGVKQDDCHIAMFDVEQCKRVVQTVNDFFGKKVQL